MEDFRKRYILYTQAINILLKEELQWMSQEKKLNNRWQKKLKKR